MTHPIAVVAAIADNGVIGRDNRLIWRLKTDLKRFRALTWGSPIIMGRRTFQSIGRPLPGRQTIVLTRDRAFSAEGVTVAHAWDEAVARAEDAAERMGAEAIFVVGGGEVYAEALPRAERLHLTLVHASPDGDALFPPYDRTAFRELRRSEHPRGPDDEQSFTFLDLERRPGAAGG
jgi:dihydrofolate reductase